MIMEELTYREQKIYFSSAEHMVQIPDNSITLVVTSPPYWNVRDYGGDQIGYQQSYDEYIKSLNRVWDECIRVLQPNGKFAINLQPLPIASEASGFDRRIIKDIMADVQAHLFSRGLYLSGMHYWDKAAYVNNVAWGSYPKPSNIHSNTSFEQIYVFVKPGRTRVLPKPEKVLPQDLLTKDEWRHWAVRCIWDDIAPVIKINAKGENLYGHDAPFPEDIPYRLIRMHTYTGESVLDPFLGSGTTLKLCRILGRKGIGFEINPDYREKIIARIDEEWVPPFVDNMYINFSATQIQDIITQTILQVTQVIEKFPEKKPDLDEIYQAVLKRLNKEKVLTKATIKRLQGIKDEQD
jgi:DNA modification methylase